eukprot:6482211-Amphidinium_carterae.1
MTHGASLSLRLVFILCKWACNGPKALREWRALSCTSPHTWAPPADLLRHNPHQEFPMTSSRLSNHLSQNHYRNMLLQDGILRDAKENL